MKISRNYVEVAIVLVLFLISLYVWTLPFQDNRFPYGDVDSSTHFTLADYQGQTDKPLHFIPYYLGEGGYKDDGQGRIWYPPQYHTNAAILQIISNSRILPILLFNALAGMTLVFTSYFLMRKLYGMMAGAVTGFMMIFSLRDILWYMWGQYPQVMSFGLVPLIAYMLYSYLESVRNKENKQEYIYFYVILLATQFFIHPQGLLISLGITLFYGLFFVLKHRIFTFPLKTVVFTIIIFAMLLVPFYEIPLRAPGDSSPFRLRLDRVNTLQHWYGTINDPHGVPENYYSFRAMNGLWILPFFLIGIIALLIRRENKDVLLLMWLLVFYLSTHELITGRGERFMEIEAQILFPIAVLGMLAIPKILKLPLNFKKYAKWALVILFLGFFIQTNATNAVDTLKLAYSGVGRITPAQYEATQWIKDNIPTDADVIILDTMIYTKKKWYQALSYRHFDWTDDNLQHVPGNPNSLVEAEYILLDYSDLVLTGRNDVIQALQNFEQNSLQNANLVYNKNNIRLYQIG